MERKEERKEEEEEGRVRRWEQGREQGRRRKQSHKVKMCVCISRNDRPHSLATPFRTFDCERDHSSRPSISHTYSY